MFIAEVGINHNGSLELAKELIDLAVRSKCDVVKFQKRNPDICVPEDQKNKLKETPWGVMTYLDYKKKIEFSEVEYDEIDRYCKTQGIQWTASVWDEDSLVFITQYDIPFIKVPSAKITDIDLLEKIKSTGIKSVMSCGMSTEEEIDVAVKVLDPMAILWCNSSYPAKDSELNLNVIQYLKWKYPSTKIGYSGHEEGISACIVAKTLGAEIIERHITLSRSMWSTDQAASLIYDQTWRLVRDLNKINIWKGETEITVFDSEEKIRKKLR